MDTSGADRRDACGGASVLAILIIIILLCIYCWASSRLSGGSGRDDRYEDRHSDDRHDDGHSDKHSDGHSDEHSDRYDDRHIDVECNGDDNEHSDARGRVGFIDNSLSTLIAARRLAPIRWLVPTQAAREDYYGPEGATVYTNKIRNPSTPDHDELVN